MKYTWDDLYDKAMDKAWFEDEVEAKDNARWQVGCYVLDKNDEDLEKCECPEEEIEFYCDKYRIRFDKYGNIVEADGVEEMAIQSDVK